MTEQERRVISNALGHYYKIVLNRRSIMLQRHAKSMNGRPWSKEDVDAICAEVNTVEALLNSAEFTKT
jgi:hypothetical protein